MYLTQLDKTELNQRKIAHQSKSEILNIVDFFNIMNYFRKQNIPFSQDSTVTWVRLLDFLFRFKLDILLLLLSLKIVELHSSISIDFFVFPLSFLYVFYN